MNTKLSEDQYPVKCATMQEEVQDDSLTSAFIPAVCHLCPRDGAIRSRLAGADE